MEISDFLKIFCHKLIIKCDFSRPRLCGNRKEPPGGKRSAQRTPPAGEAGELDKIGSAGGLFHDAVRIASVN